MFDIRLIVYCMFNVCLCVVFKICIYIYISFIHLCYIIYSTTTTIQFTVLLYPFTALRTIVHCDVIAQCFLFALPASSYNALALIHH